MICLSRTYKYTDFFERTRSNRLLSGENRNRRKFDVYFAYFETVGSYLRARLHHRVPDSSFLHSSSLSWQAYDVAYLERSRSSRVSFNGAPLGNSRSISTIARAQNSNPISYLSSSQMSSGTRDSLMSTPVTENGKKPAEVTTPTFVFRASNSIK